ncbi:tyrosine-protein phosphatase non-receptor type 22 isoform X2 [Bufo gargarizans]|uniref:tyrosine-protein phosphatase non-receptor type 22 isoform X2 n=1 Tax=Bufo gargarizans TaxID=30331 RepID=UPI001CF3179A|nr:tyrosine-protein phosphatase non-receptor type 22 isoform X2 [Bufo gargarizans]
MEQREIIQRYIDGYEKKRTKSEEFANDFMNLKRQSAKYKTDNNYTTVAAERPENFKKNRYKDIFPFDHSRVELSLITSDEETDYINASFIKGVYGPRAYIATQGPLANTVVDFWRMIWEYNIGIIVMACMEFEMGKKKCERYWAEVGCEVLPCGPFSITCTKEEKKTDYVIRLLAVTYGNEIRIVHQIHYKNWPDHDVPSSVKYILEMIQDIRLLQRDDTPPLCIHCSAGCGRTGVICAIDYVWRLLKDQIIPVNFSIYSIIQEMRTQRSSLVQTKEQYELVYNAVIYLFKKELKKINGLSGSEEDMTFKNAPHPQGADRGLINLPRGFTGQIREDIHQWTGGSSAAACNSGTDFTIFEPLTPSKMYKNRGNTEENILKSQTQNRIDQCFDVPHPLPRTHYGKHSQNVTCDDNLNAKRSAAERKMNSGHTPLTRTKSTPFELHQRRQSCILANTSKETDMYQDEFDVLSLMKQGPNLTSSLGNLNTVHSSHIYIRLTEDPYFSPTLSSDPGSPKFADFCLEAICPEITNSQVSGKQNAGSLMSESHHLGHMNEPDIQRPLEGADVPRFSNLNGKSDDSPPPLPERTPESFIVPDEQSEQCIGTEQSQDSSKLQPVLQSRIGMSLEWGGVSQRKIDDFRHMARSKSVKVRGSKLEKIQNRSPSPPPLPERTEESYIIADEACYAESIVPEIPGPLHLTEREISGCVPPSAPEQEITRKKSMKILRNMKKNVCSVAKTESASSGSSSPLSFLHFGFGKRFAKPKGPRKPPATWNI